MHLPARLGIEMAMAMAIRVGCLSRQTMIIEEKEEGPCWLSDRKINLWNLSNNVQYIHSYQGKKNQSYIVSQ